MKRIKSTSSFLIALAGSLVAFSAYAQCGCLGSLPTGWYVEGNAGQSRVSGVSNSNGSNTTGMGWNANAGYKFTPYFGLEGGYTSYATNNLKSNGVRYAKNTFRSWDIAMKGIFPVPSTGIELFAKAGAAQIQSNLTISNKALAAANNVSKSNTKKVGVYLGAGADLFFFPNFGVNVQWARAKGNSNNTGTLDLYSVGIDIMLG